MHLRRAAILAVLALAAAACSSTGASPTAPPAESPATRIEVTLADALRIEPATMSVPAGVPVTFVVSNMGALEHEFYLGDEAAQAEHEAEMLEMGGMGHDEPEGIAVAPGETKELTYTFHEPGEVVAGCHVEGHYGGGMRAAIAVTE